MIPETTGLDLLCQLLHNLDCQISATYALPVPPPWDLLSPTQQASTRNLAEWCLKEGEVEPEWIHETWCESMEAAGWTWGASKDPGQRTHPLLVYYLNLPEPRKLRLCLFAAVCNTWRAGKWRVQS